MRCKDWAATTTSLSPSKRISSVMDGILFSNLDILDEPSRIYQDLYFARRSIRTEDQQSVKVLWQRYFDRANAIFKIVHLLNISVCVHCDQIDMTVKLCGLLYLRAIQIREISRRRIYFEEFTAVSSTISQSAHQGVNPPYSRYVHVIHLAEIRELARLSQAYFRRSINCDRIQDILFVTLYAVWYRRHLKIYKYISAYVYALRSSDHLIFSVLCNTWNYKRFIAVMLANYRSFKSNRLNVIVLALR